MVNSQKPNQTKWNLIRESRLWNHNGSIEIGKAGPVPRAEVGGGLSICRSVRAHDLFQTPPPGRMSGLDHTSHWPFRDHDNRAGGS